MKKLIVGNWKMNLGLDEAKSLIADIINQIFEDEATLSKCELAVCPSYLHIGAVRHAVFPIDFIAFGAQDCSLQDNGAFTGDISAQMLADGKCSYVILGHSERRTYHQESDQVVADKAAKAHAAGLKTIICVGESEEEREQGRQEEVVAGQLKASLPSSANAENTVIAYEPVWAIGTGKNASPEDVKAMHGFIRKKMQEQLENSENLRILYGGSMNPENAGDLLATENVDGGLIGGASLKAETFLAIAQSA